ncbi:uncharacterized protein [Prorops nasuta]|uniref:uncharacterized protein isoform X2 n=1 Tax=Prorops nasuta TaxID=863751 RepID=UPI0034CF1293
MAEVATKKSINVVSNKKSEVCNVQSNNGLIDLDNITSSNNQLISLCDTNDDDDDLILTNNTRNELDTEDKSLQELIESELALRICSSNDDEVLVMEDPEEEPRPPPEPVKRIVLDRQPDLLDVNTEFIVAESEHCSITEDPYNYQNGHIPLERKNHDLLDQQIDNIQHERIDMRDKEECEIFGEQPEFGTDATINETVQYYAPREEAVENLCFVRSEAIEPVEISDFDCQPPAVDNVDASSISRSPLLRDKYQQEEESRGKMLNDAGTVENCPDDTDQVLSPQDNYNSSNPTEQFSDNFHDSYRYEDHECEIRDDRFCGPDSRRSRNLEEEALTPSENSDAASTQEFIDTERSVLAECRMAEANVREAEGLTGSAASNSDILENLDWRKASIEKTSESPVSSVAFDKSRESREVDQEEVEGGTRGNKFDSWMTVEEATDPKQTDEQMSSCMTSVGTMDVNEPTINDRPVNKRDESPVNSPLAPLATPDDETSDISNTCDSESREESITSSTTLVTSSTGKSGTKTKKKKIEGVAGNDASPNNTPRTKKTKKSKKNDLEKENISVNCNLQDSSMHACTRQSHPEMIDFSDEDLSNVNVKSLTQNYVSEATRNEYERSCRERIATGVSIKQLCRSFGDISSMCDDDQSTFGKVNHSLDSEEKTRSMGDLRLCEEGYRKLNKDGCIFTGVSVKALRASYCSLASLTSNGKEMERGNELWRLEKSSFNKFDALSKKTVLHVRSVDAGKVQQQLNAVGQNGDSNPTCRSCGKVVFQMEQTKAEGLVWHKNCFRCVQCSKQLNVDNYESHESTLYCKAHFKELFQPKPVEETEHPASDKPDLGLEELSSLNVKSRFQVFEKASTENTNDIERSPSQVAVKRSASILSKLAKFQAKGMDIGVADDSLNGIHYEESSESETEEEEEDTEDTERDIVKAKRTTRERPISFSKMDDIKNRWETTSQQGRRETQREARKEEIAGIRSRLFMGKQGKMKEMYQQAVAGSERVTKINAAEEIQHTTNARSIKERFERGEPIAATDDETDNKPKPEKADEEVIAAGISRKSRSLFLELDASAAKTGRPVTPVNPKTPVDAPRRARDAFMGRQVSDDVVRSSDQTEEVHVETSDISNKFKFFETYKEPEKQRKQFRITPPRDGQVKMDSPEREIYRDPGVVRAEDRVSEVVHTDTARKMLSIFRQMEEKATKEDLPDGPKPLKRFTPPPEDKFAKATASDTEDDEDEEEESGGEDSGDDRDPNYVRASDKVEDEFLKQAQNAARAKTLRAKFEHWEETDGKVSNHNVAEMEIAQGSTGDQSSIESASSLRKRFESLGSQNSESPRTPKVKVNRFVEIQATCMDICESCQKKVYPLEKVETSNKIFHKQCFRCLQCNCILRMDTFTLNNGKLYCIPHFKQLFITRGNYDEGFGVDPHKNKWSSNNTNGSTTPAPIAVSNGDL